MMGSLGNASRSIRTVSPTPRLWPCAVETATTSSPRSTSAADVGEDALAVQFAKRVARGRDRRAADQAEMRVARRLELRVPLLRDALHVAHREQPVQPVLVVHHQQLVDAGVVGEELVGLGDGVAAQFLLVERVDLAARRQRLGNLAFGVALLDDMAREQAHQLALRRPPPGTC